MPSLAIPLDFIEKEKKKKIDLEFQNQTFFFRVHIKTKESFTDNSTQLRPHGCGPAISRQAIVALPTIVAGIT